MSKIKMSDAFKLPIVVDTEYDDYTVNEVNCLGLVERHADYAVIAINSYDSNQELMAKQAEQIELLREALSEISKVSGRVSPQIARKALAATAKG